MGTCAYVKCENDIGGAFAKSSVAQGARTWMRVPGQVGGAIMLDIKRVLAAKPRPAEKIELNHLSTKYGDALDASRVLSDHPHPQFCRDSFFSLNGWWE